jgi:hypothetical protein
MKSAEVVELRGRVSELKENHRKMQSEISVLKSELKEEENRAINLPDALSALAFFECLIAEDQHPEARLENPTSNQNVAIAQIPVENIAIHPKSSTAHEEESSDDEHGGYGGCEYYVEGHFKKNIARKHAAMNQTVTGYTARKHVSRKKNGKKRYEED